MTRSVSWPKLRACRECGQSFELKRSSRYRYCSHTCNRKARNRRGKLAAYGLTVAAFEELRRQQGGVCALCMRPPNGRGTALHVDHDHATGRVRGLLCHSCNVALGNLAAAIATCGIGGLIGEYLDGRVVFGGAAVRVGGSTA